MKTKALKKLLNCWLQLKSISVWLKSLLILPTVILFTGGLMTKQMCLMLTWPSGSESCFHLAWMLSWQKYFSREKTQSLPSLTSPFFLHPFCPSFLPAAVFIHSLPLSGLSFWFPTPVYVLPSHHQSSKDSIWPGLAGGHCTRSFFRSQTGLSPPEWMCLPSGRMTFPCGTPRGPITLFLLHWEKWMESSPLKWESRIK